MKLICAPQGHKFKDAQGVLNIVLFGRTDRQVRGHAGAAIREIIEKGKYRPAPRAWDFLSLALSVIAADLAGFRTKSPDGWTREMSLEVAVFDPDFWNANKELVQHALGFLTTDIWHIDFTGGGYCPKVPKALVPPEDCVSLLSGGLDSFVGNIDLVASGKRPLAVSQVVLGDAANQRLFAQVLGGGLRHLQMNHNAEVPTSETPSSQRARSLIFLAYGVLAATSLNRYHQGGDVTLYVCENGFISINPPLTDMRLGSLSTRTTHPAFFSLLHKLFKIADLRVRLENPYQLRTKGEMLAECVDQKLVRQYASQTTSCGRYLIHKHEHCGRCVPCLVRRAAFRASGHTDATEYVFSKLGKNDADHAHFDDVRAVAIAVAAAKAVGLERWLGVALSTTILGDVLPIQKMVGRGLGELEQLLQTYGVS